MLTITVTLHSALTNEKTEIAKMHICNDNTGTNNLGNYFVYLLKKGTTEVYRKGRVIKHERNKLHVWTLVLKALRDCYPEI